MDEAILKLIAMLETVSPVVWQAARKEALLEGIAHIVMASIMIISYIFIFRLVKNTDLFDDFSDGAAVALAVVMSCMVWVVIAVIMLDGIYAFVNPDWYAFKTLLGAIPH